MNVNQKDLILLPYPFSDQKGSKVRPAIVVSNNVFNEDCQDCILVPLTTVIKEVPYSLLVRQSDLSSGKLLKESKVRVDKIFALNKRLVIMKVGRIGDECFGKIRREIVRIFV